MRLDSYQNPMFTTTLERRIVPVGVERAAVARRRIAEA
jgi:hypothetical protein